MANRKPPLYKPYGRPSPTSSWNTATGQRKQLPSKFNTATGEMMPQSFEEAGMQPEAYGIQGPTPFERNMPRFDTANFDVNDPEMVADFQKKFMGMKEGDAGYGMMGPKTTARFRQYVAGQRAGEGLEQYRQPGEAPEMYKMVDETGKPDAREIDKLIKEQEEAGMYQNDIPEDYDMLDSLQDTMGGAMNYFRDSWQNWWEK
tara:strand:- start:527 stop:1132 length:606 start_codon:yes stop_codon:yes gene_type:complete